jgi:putative redox protein
MGKTIIKLSDGFRTNVKARDHVWHADLPEDGRNTAPDPEEMLLGALGSCMAQTAKLYAERKGWQIDRIAIALDFERINGDEYPGYNGDANIVHEIHADISIEGTLDEDQKARVLQIMGKCPVRRLITNPVFIKETVLDPDPAGV